MNKFNLNDIVYYNHIPHKILGIKYNTIYNCYEYYIHNTDSNKSHWINEYKL